MDVLNHRIQEDFWCSRRSSNWIWNNPCQSVPQTFVRICVFWFRHCPSFIMDDWLELLHERQKEFQKITMHKVRYPCCGGCASDPMASSDHRCSFLGRRSTYEEYQSCHEEFFRGLHWWISNPPVLAWPWCLKASICWNKDSYSFNFCCASCLHDPASIHCLVLA